MVSRILVPTDGSKTARKAVTYACGLAKQTKAGIILLSVMDRSAFLASSVPAGISSSRIMESLEDYLKAVAEASIGTAEKICRKNRIRAKSVTRSGHPVEEIVKEAKRSKVDIIVLGSRGKSAITSAVLGSVTFGVIHKSRRVPVLVIRS